MDASTAAYSAACSAVCLVASTAMMWVAQLDERLVVARADLKDTSMVVQLVIASVVWKERTLVAWLVAMMDEMTVGMMVERSAELRAALTAMTSAVGRVLVKVVQTDASTAVYSAPHLADRLDDMLVASTERTTAVSWGAPWVASMDASTAVYSAARLAARWDHLMVASLVVMWVVQMDDRSAASWAASKGDSSAG